MLSGFLRSERRSERLFSMPSGSVPGVARGVGLRILLRWSILICGRVNLHQLRRGNLSNQQCLDKLYQLSSRNTFNNHRSICFDCVQQLFCRHVCFHYRRNVLL